MSTTMYAAQKGLILNKSRSKILVQKYNDAKFNSNKVKGKFGLPGGKMGFGEWPADGLKREIKEETGIDVNPIIPFYSWTWIYTKKGKKIQIVATAWLCYYKSGKIQKPVNEEEVELDIAAWIDLKNLNILDFIVDERPALEKFFEYQKKNPFAFG